MTFAYQPDAASGTWQSDTTWATSIPAQSEYFFTRVDLQLNCYDYYRRSYLIDVNGDGLSDVVHNGTAYLNTGSGWSTSNTWSVPATAFDADYRMADVNGDGLPRLTQAGSVSTTIRLA